MDERLDRLLALAEQQHATIVEQGRLQAERDERHAQVVGALVQGITQQGEHIGLLTQSVVLLLGEEAGHPVADDEDEAPQRVDLDGNSY